MKCTRIRLDDGTFVILCGSKRLPVCVSGRIAHLECDWKVGITKAGKVTTCDAPLCDRCTTSPAPGKDLCPKHATAWESHPSNRQKQLPLE